MKTTPLIAFLLQFTIASAATTKVLRKRNAVTTRSLGVDKLKEYSAKLAASPAENVDSVALARHGSPVSVQCFTDTTNQFADLEFEIEPSSCNDEDGITTCDYSYTAFDECTQAGGVVVRDTINYCGQGLIWKDFPFCIAKSCDDDVTYGEIVVDFLLPITFSLFGVEGVVDGTTLEEAILASGFGTCPATPSTKEPKSSRAPSNKMPKSSKNPSSRAPKSSKFPSSKEPKSSKAPESTKSPSTKEPKSTKAPKSTSTKSPKGTIAAAISSGSTMETTAAATAAAAVLTFFAL